PGGNGDHVTRVEVARGTLLPAIDLADVVVVLDAELVGDRREEVAAADRVLLGARDAAVLAGGAGGGPLGDGGGPAHGRHGGVAVRFDRHRRGARDAAVV